MDVNVQNLRATYIQQADVADPPPVDVLESLCQQLTRCALERGGTAGAASAILGDESFLAEQLQTLKLGPAPAGLHELVEREWESLANEWATLATMKTFDGQLRRLLQPFGQAVADKYATADEIAWQQERLETLRALAELLDELIEDEPPHGADATSPAEVRNPVTGGEGF